MKKGLFAMSALFGATAVFGSGFQTLEQGASNLGTALAGSSVNANADASAAFWNPSSGFNAGLKVGETKVDLAGNIVISKFDFVCTKAVSNFPPDPNPIDGRTGKSGDAGCVNVVPNFFVLHQLTEDILLSLSVTAPYALETDYDDDWVGRQMALNSNLTTFDINPSVAYKINDYLSISGGVSAQWLHANLSSSPDLINEYTVTGSSWSVGGNIGFTVNYAEDGRFGFQWRSEVSHNITGNNHRNDSVIYPVECDVDLPQSFTVGWYQRLRGDLKRFALMIDYSYTLWSCFDRLYISNTADPSNPACNQDEDWRNTSRVCAGIHFFPLENDDLVIRLGTAWDQTPIKDSKHRYARIPCTDRIWFSGGIGYKYENFNIDLAYTYILFCDEPNMNDKTTINGLPFSSEIEGYFEGRAHVVSVQIGYKF